MINAGAIATCGQVLKKDGRVAHRAHPRATSRAVPARRLEVDEEVYRSESATGHRNRAIGWMLRNFGILDEDPDEILEIYFQQCSLRVTCADLAVMGATLANQGVNPITGERAIAQDYVDNVLGVMATCGMYDWSGEWIYRVGLPAKSGVGGGILAVLPGQLGIGVFSPPLDAQGNSVARHSRVHGPGPRTGAAPLQSQRGAAARAAPELQRDPGGLTPTAAAAALQAVRRYGERIRVMEMQGPLMFSTFEPVVRTLVKQAPYCRHVVISFRHVVSADAGEPAPALAGPRAAHKNRSQSAVLPGDQAGARSHCRSEIPATAIFDSEDAALEACEDTLLDGGDARAVARAAAGAAGAVRALFGLRCGRYCGAL